MLPSLRWPEALLVLSFTAHVLLVAPTKVEESFVLTAVRDILVHGVHSPERFDHLEFRGAVPRSFVAPTLLAGLAWLPLRALAALDLVQTGLDAQVLVRLSLALASALSLIFLSRAVRGAYGVKVAKYFLLLAATQFHVPFWAGRTLPNMLAFPLVQIAVGLLIAPPALSSVTRPRRATQSHLLTAFALLTFAAVVIRLELAALLAPFALEHLARGLVGFRELLATGMVTAAGSLVLSVAVDTHFWQSPTWLWPEGHAFLFNVVEGKSAEWGVSPPSYYFLSALPKLLHLALAPALFSLIADRRTRRLLLPCLAFIALLSGLQHKEWRFVVYVVPAFTVAAAAGVVAIGSLSASPQLRRLSLLALLALNLALTTLGLVASSGNYPGAAALAALERALPPRTHGGAPAVWRVHIAPAAKMAGASNFLVLDSAHAPPPREAWYLSPRGVVPPAIVYDRSESEPESREAPSRRAYDYALVGADEHLPVGAEVFATEGEFGGWDARALLRGDWGQVRRQRDAVRAVKLPASGVGR
ncbi:hypothetical protein JCM3770_003479 [Rhodotorula araucariae]